MICGAQIELNFSQHGWDEYYEDYPTLSYTRTMNYVEIPFLAHLAFGTVLAGKVDVMLISSLDRIGRDWGMTKQYIALLTEHKVKLLCLRERVSIDSSGFSPFST